MFAPAFPTQAAIAATPSLELSATPVPIKEATVNLYCRLKAGKKIMSTSGSGVFVSPRGVILTNAHVAQYHLLAGEKGRVTGSCTVRTGSPATDTYTASLLYFPAEWLAENGSQISEKTPRGTGMDDFALLVVTGAKNNKPLPASFPFLPIETLAVPVDGQDVTIGGYPVEDMSFKEVQRKLKQVIARSAIEDVRSFDAMRLPDVLMLASSEAGAGGTSGGPVVNAAGSVIAIANSKSTDADDRGLRAITIPYVDRTLRTETGLTLRELFASDLSARILSTAASIPQKTITDLANGLRKKK